MNEKLESIAMSYEKAYESWENSKFEWFKILAGKTKGHIGEKIVNDFLESKGTHSIEKSTSRDHDCIVDGRKKEIKTATLSKSNTFIFNQIRQFQDYDDIIFLCVYPNKVELYEIDSKKFMEHIINDDISSGRMIAGGQKKEKECKDKSKLGGKHWMMYNDLFNWRHENKMDWPEGTVRLDI